MQNVTAAQRTAANVRAEMARKRISQTKLAESLGWSQGAVSRRLSGRVALDLNELERIADQLGVTIFELIVEVAA